MNTTKIKHGVEDYLYSILYDAVFESIESPTLAQEIETSVEGYDSNWYPSEETDELNSILDNVADKIEEVSKLLTKAFFLEKKK